MFGLCKCAGMCLRAVLVNVSLTRKGGHQQRLVAVGAPFESSSHARARERERGGALKQQQSAHACVSTQLYVGYYNFVLFFFCEPIMLCAVRCFARAASLEYEIRLIVGQLELQGGGVGWVKLFVRAMCLMGFAF